MKAQAFVSRRQAAAREVKAHLMTGEFRIHRLEDRDVQASLALEVVVEHPLVAYPRPWQWRRRGPTTVRKLKIAVSPPSRMHRRVPPGISSGYVLGSFMVVASGDAGYTGLCARRSRVAVGGVRSQFHGAESILQSLQA